MKQYQLKDSPIVYYISGAGHKQWVLFLHAAFVDHRMFNKQIAYFQAAYNVLTLDLIGHGNSTDTRKGDTLADMSGWIHAILEKHAIHRLHIVGISLGAILAQDFANRYSAAVQSLACFGGYDINRFDADIQKENGTAHLLMMVKAIFSVKWFAASNQTISAYTKQAQQDFYEMNLDFPKSSFRYLSSLNSLINAVPPSPRSYPLLIGCGQHVTPAEKDAITMWKKNEPSCQVVILEGAGHCVNMDVPQQFNHILEHFWTDSSICDIIPDTNIHRLQKR